MRFPYGTWHIDTAKSTVALTGQLHIEGGALAVVAPNGELIAVYAPGHWRFLAPWSDQ